MKKDRKLTMNIGIISFVMIFIILCMITFAILSLASAKSNRDSNLKSILHKEEYYQLSNQGQDILQEIDDFLYQKYQTSTSKEQYFNSLSAIKTVHDTITIEEHIVSFYCSSKSQKLYVEIEILYPGKQLYTIRTWKTESNKEWSPDNNINIL